MAIIFDLDGTLINSFGIHAELIKKAADSILGKGAISEEFINKNIKFPSKIMLKMVEKEQKTHISDRQMSAIIKLKDSLFTPRYIKKIKFYPGAVQMLRFLKNKNLKFCIATSMNGDELKKVNPFLKLDSLSEIVNAPPLKHEKPDPYIINKAIRLLDADRKKTFYVGDAETDYMASGNAKIKFIGVNNPSLKDKGYMYFRDTSSLSLFLKRNYRCFF